MRVELGAILHQLEMEVRAGRIAGAAHEPDQGALGDTVPAAYVDDTQMGVEGLPAIAMVKDNHIPVSPVVPA